MELSSDTLLKDRYQIEKQLGQGGMGAVYLATDTALETKVAVKVNQNPGQHSSRQFLREARLLAGLRHPNLPRVTDYFILDDTQYLVMDYIPGEDLSTRVKKEGALPLHKVLEWARELGKALTYLHSQTPPIVHRDIKPSNIKLTSDGEPVLVDFGIAKASDPSKVTTTGARGYTPGFAPPEQYGEGSTGPYSDQYALGATLYTLITGQSPTDAVQRMLAQAELKPVQELNPDVPSHVDAAIQKAVAIQPEKRFESISEFINAMEDSATIVAVPVEPTMMARTRAGVTAVVGDAIAEAPAPPRRRSFPIALLVAFIIIGGGAVFAFLWLTGKIPGLPAIASLGGTPTHTQSPTVDTGLLAISSPSVTDTALPVLLATDTPTPTETVPPEDTGTPTPSITPTPVGGGGLIAFTSNRLDGRTFQIYTMRSDGSDLQVLTTGPGNKTQPTWSPDAQILLYVADGGQDIYGNRLGLDIWKMNADGTDPVNLTQAIGDDEDPVWSPDGRRIAFTSDRTNGVKQVFFMNPDGSDQINISQGLAVEFSPTWSPDMQWLAYAFSINNAPATLGLRSGGGAVSGVLGYFDQSNRIGQIDDPDWSPDGTRIVYTWIKPGQNEIFVAPFSEQINERGLNLIQLTNSLGNKEPTWSPDSLWIVFTSTREQNAEIFIMTANGTLQTNLTNHQGQDMQPDWQPLPNP